MLSHVQESSHAISRSTELLSVARTALRILQQNPETPPDLLALSSKDLSLHHNIIPSNDAIEALDEASLTLNLLDSTLKSLSELVKRRGTTNDPTEEINRSIASFHTYSKGILEVIQNSLPQSAVLSPYIDAVVRSSSQRSRHYEFVASVLKIRVEKRMEEFKEIMEVRGNVIKDQALRRKQLLIGNKTRNTSINRSETKPPLPMAPKSGGIRMSRGFAPVGMDRKTKSQMNSPLFTVSHSQPKSQSTMKIRNQNGSANGNPQMNDRQAPSPYGAPQNVGYGGAAYGGGYGGNPHSSNNTGMRRRAGASSATNNTNGYNPYQEEENKIHDANSVQAQIQMRRENRQSQKRLESARQAEKSLAELTTMFSKMSNLIHSQGETLVKIEDDVEAAMDHVEAGREEIIKLHEWTKGNRSLIIKVFAILIFCIAFMRFYG
jgi:hypothetical protein